MDINKKNRSDLKSYFVKNSIPTASNFADLVDGMLNQKDDGIVKLPGDPLSIEAAGDSTGLQKVLNFYGKLQDPNPVWSLQLNPRMDDKTTNRGFCLVDGANVSRLFIEQSTGNIGIATITPKAKLDISGIVRFGLDEGGSGIKSISFARDTGDEINGGKITYKGNFGADSLNIVGAGVPNTKRKIKLYDNVEVVGSLNVTGGATLSSNLLVKGIANISDGNGYAVPNNCMAKGSLTIGSITTNYGGGNNWTGNTAGLLLETQANTEIAVHDADNRVASIMYYEGDTVNRFTIGRDMGWGVTPVTIASNLTIGDQTVKNSMNGTGLLSLKGPSPQIDFNDSDNNDWSIHVNSNKMYFIREPWTYDSLVLDGNGNVGIGTDNPTKAKLEVTGSTAIPYTNLTVGWVDPRGVGGGGTINNVRNYSIYASNAIMGSDIYAFSDERIKNIQGRSDNATDLQTLLGIEIIDYRYKDVISKGDAPHKKVIAQQVEQVFPQAVSKHTDVVPDIYQPASIIDGWVELATDLQPGERVRLICDKTEGVFDVLEVTKDKFRADFKPNGDQVFVFGREVNDFCNVDYDAIAMLNVSATQQLKKEIDALKVENVDLNVRLAVLEAKI
ncbi:MAG: tail fiber domain-containing protein [Methylococcaceae bacterium]